jgi:hypothetical protein
LVGGFVVADKGWRWTEWTILFLAVFTYCLAFGMKETYKKKILERHAKQNGIQVPSGPSGLAALKFMFYITFFRPLHMLYTEPIVVAWSLYIGFNFAVLYSTFAAFPFVYAHVYGFDIQHIGLTFISLAIGSTLGALTIILVDKLLYRKFSTLNNSQQNSNKTLPEHRLYAAMIGTFGMPIGLFWFAWTAREDVHWISSVVAAVFIAWGNLCVFVSEDELKNTDMPS